MEEITSDLESFSEVRKYLVEELRKDILGPSSVDEILTERPSLHYLTGILYPDETSLDPEEDNDANDAVVADDDIDPGVLMAAAFNPSAMGLTFTVNTGDTLIITPSAAVYQYEAISKPEDNESDIGIDVEENNQEILQKDSNKEIKKSSYEADSDAPVNLRSSDDINTTKNSEDEGSDGELVSDENLSNTEKSDTNSSYRENWIWKRKILHIEELSIDTSERNISPVRLDEGLLLHIRLRRRDDLSVITVSLINTYRKDKTRSRVDELCYFQPSIEVKLSNESESFFLSRQDIRGNLLNPDRQRNRLLYRHSIEYAVGHGCAVYWEEEKPGKANRIWTDFIPAYETHQLSPDWMTPVAAQDMEFLATADQEQIISELTKFTDIYFQWLETQEKQYKDLPSDLKTAGRKNIDACIEAHQRMLGGIDLLRDSYSFEAFCSANLAMHIQRSRINEINTRNSEESDPEKKNQKNNWRPFQLAFFLICLSSTSNPEDPFRDVVDLLWFPTGGGKTEAYLGLSAYVIFFRRLKAENKELASGVTIMMRYTLRLLTLQQYQRAASLIMACEIIRRGNPEKFGMIPITLGLWVGRGATPNTLKEARENLGRLLQDEDIFEANPFQIRKCPWCGIKLTPRNYKCHDVMTIYCPNDNCDFKDGFPLYLIDEDIYKKRPTLILGTVDKFARIPWVEQSGNLFGISEPERLPPELIIQDELHLITGPLGTMVGLYEIAVDALCSNKGVRPKVIASTATIRRAEEQVRGLYNRGLRDFPPQGLDIRDSFFAREVPLEEKPGRLFLGVHAQGKSMKTTELRIYALLLQRIFEHKSPDLLRDPYWTLIGYFNSLRELGSSVRLVDDDVRARMKVIKNPDEEIREIDEPYELTSRISSREIPVRLEQMFENLTSGSAIDVLLATNMISVGVDVDRLGLMVVTGQPKLTSEYIQATSRVGRKFPGLIVTYYNWARPRDRSHYERFVGYHSTLYSQVEASSVTPFSSRARDRGLHGVYISLVRHLIPEMRAESAATKFDSSGELIAKIRKVILERVENLNPEEQTALNEQLSNIDKTWELLAKQSGLVYGQKIDDLSAPHLMGSPEYIDTEFQGAFPTLNSLREVEGESEIMIIPDRRKEENET